MPYKDDSWQDELFYVISDKDKCWYDKLWICCKTGCLPDLYMKLPVLNHANTWKIRGD